MSKQIRISDESFDKINERKGRLSYIAFFDELILDNNFNEPKKIETILMEEK